MKPGLNQIGSAGLFHNYLESPDIRKLALNAIESHWEYKHDERLVAAIQIEAAKQAHFYLDVRQISAR